MSAGRSATLNCLRHRVADIEGGHLSLEEGRRVALGIGAIDAALNGGLACGALHKVSPSAPFDLGAACGFAFALAARACGETLLIQQDFATLEAGCSYGPGLDCFGLTLAHLLVLRVARPIDALWTMEEALKCRALKVVIAELNDDALADLTATRRLALAAREGNGICFLLSQSAVPAPSAAMTHWHVAAATSRPDEFGGLGHAAFDLSLVKNRHGPCGRWVLTWHQHARVFSPLSVGVAAPALDRPDRAPLTRAG